MKPIIRYFLQGLLLIAPLGITIYIIYAIFEFVDRFMNSLIGQFMDIKIPGLGLVVFVVLIIFTGLIGQTFIARPFKLFFQKIMDRTPFLKVIYSALNDLFTAFIGNEKKFDKPVLVKVNPVTNLEKLGFMTEGDLKKLDQADKLAVYFPHSYNFSGELFIVPKDQVTPIKNIGPAEVMKFIVSGGVSGWEH
jgi:uncharacterized membrane protein